MNRAFFVLAKVWSIDVGEFVIFDLEGTLSCKLEEDTSGRRLF